MQIPIKPELKKIENANGKITEAFPLPTDEQFLLELLKYIFENFWDQIIFGPIIDGAAYEMRCPSQPTKIDYSSGYLTMFFGVTHFHLCIGDITDNPSDELNKRKTHRAEYYRDLDRIGAPVSWGLRLYTGLGDQQLTILFPNPFVTEDDQIREEPDWARLRVWDQLQERYFGRPVDPKDRLADGFSHM